MTTPAPIAGMRVQSHHPGEDGFDVARTGTLVEVNAKSFVVSWDVDEGKVAAATVHPIDAWCSDITPEDASEVGEPQAADRPIVNNFHVAPDSFAGAHKVSSTMEQLIERERTDLEAQLARLSELPHLDIVRFFSFSHLPEHLKRVSFEFAKMAAFIVRNGGENAERTVALRKLLEAKDATVRSAL